MQLHSMPSISIVFHVGSRRDQYARWTIETGSSKSTVGKRRDWLLGIKSYRRQANIVKHRETCKNGHEF